MKTVPNKRSKVTASTSNQATNQTEFADFKVIAYYSYRSFGICRAI